MGIAVDSGDYGFRQSIVVLDIPAGCHLELTALRRRRVAAGEASGASELDDERVERAVLRCGDAK
jgi:hypothetical protein